ncbi:MAG: T9SS type A sorting domain-containing protein, partial [Bacteroidetes bacterium]|nr:T9SS type A sorting domain-containing protein [Bacteroidota bacterium]
NTGDQTNINIRIYNVLGSVVYSERDVNIFNKLIKTLDLSSLPGGIYHLRVDGKKGSAIKRIIIER